MPCLKRMLDSTQTWQNTWMVHFRQWRTPWRCQKPTAAEVPIAKPAAHLSTTPSLPTVHVFSLNPPKITPSLPSRATPSSLMQTTCSLSFRGSPIYEKIAYFYLENSIHSTSRKLSVYHLQNALYAPYSHKATKKFTWQTHGYYLPNSSSSSTWQRMSEKYPCKPSTDWLYL